MSAQSLIEGVDEWAEAATKAGTRKWVGARVPFPVPRERPAATGHVDLPQVPLSVHSSPGVTAKRLRQVLKAAEEAQQLLSATGWVSAFGDGGQAGTVGHDLYLVTDAQRGADAGIDATEPMWGLDGARAFAILDARVPSDHLLVCTTEALVSAYLYELDPAEAPSVRLSSAAYVAWLVTGQLGCDQESASRERAPERAVLAQEPSASGTGWLIALSRRQDLNTGVFLRDMWQFARQRTWDGSGLRASPDLFEAIAAALKRGDEQLEDVAAELADHAALPGLAPGAKQHLPWTELRWSSLPQRVAPADPPLEPLGSVYTVVRMDQPPKPGDRIRVWSRGEYGTRWALSVLRVGKDGRSLGRMSAPPRKNPSSFLTLELDAETAALLISVTNVSDGIPDADEGAPFEVRSVALTVDQGHAGELSTAEAL